MVKGSWSANSAAASPQSSFLSFFPFVAVKRHGAAGLSCRARSRAVLEPRP